MRNRPAVEVVWKEMVEDNEYAAVLSAVQCKCPVQITICIEFPALLLVQNLNLMYKVET